MREGQIAQQKIYRPPKCASFWRGKGEIVRPAKRGKARAHALIWQHIIVANTCLVQGRISPHRRMCRLSRPVMGEPREMIIPRLPPVDGLAGTELGL